MANFDLNILVAPIFALVGAWIGASSTVYGVKKQIKYNMLTRKQEKLALLSTSVWQYQKIIINYYLRKDIRKLSPKDKNNIKINLNNTQDKAEQIIRAYFPKVHNDFVEIYENIYDILKEFEKIKATEKEEVYKVFQEIINKLNEQVENLDKKVNCVIQEEIEKELWLQESFIDNIKWLIFKQIKAFLTKKCGHKTKIHKFTFKSLLCKIHKFFKLSRKYVTTHRH